jgi:hypothetical protein
MHLKTKALLQVLGIFSFFSFLYGMCSDPYKTVKIHHSMFSIALCLVLNDEGLSILFTSWKCI